MKKKTKKVKSSHKPSRIRTTKKIREAAWVDIDDVSAHLKVNKETVRRWIKTQDFPSHRAGNLLRFKLSEVDAWVRQ